MLACTLPSSLYQVNVPPVQPLALNVAVSPSQIVLAVTVTFVGVVGFAFTVNVTTALFGLSQALAVQVAV